MVTKERGLFQAAGQQSKENNAKMPTAAINIRQMYKKESRAGMRRFRWSAAKTLHKGG
ncbi:MAG: hypothetical protein KBT34_04985 [Prevotella sp.]|nr:hypothetical protein [Candidatus Prevotella equi]